MAKPHFAPVDTKVKFPKVEEEILDFWEKNNIFQKTLDKTRNGKKYITYEGPPTANGKPHLGHVITRAFKDVFPRYKTMQGFSVLRKGGWDTHGLPVEVAVEKKLGISGKDQIEDIVKGDKTASIKKFNELCKESVWEYVDLWKKMIKRVGHWIDIDDAYVTYDNDYIESVWWSLKKLFNEGYLYRDYKVVPFCTRCETPLSSHELAQDYQETEDPSVYVKFKVKGEKNTYLVAWTTTPWTLPGNVALAIGESHDYVKVESDNEVLILAKKAAERLEIEGKSKNVKGKDLIGLEYEPLYDYISKKHKDNKNLHTVVAADFVDVEDGTGIVHTAVMYGVDDFVLGKKLDLPKHHLVDLKGKFTNDAEKFEGLYVKKADPEIISDLTDRGLMYKSETAKHQYPFCWRCHKPLIYYALDSWFIRTTDFKEKLIKNNNEVNWVPSHVRDGRMRNWYETLVDWSLSRNRYWGTPLPIWMCEKCDHMEAVDSKSEIKARANRKHDWKNFDLHRPWVDDIEFDCTKCDGVMRRTPEVIDVWYDSGAMPFAQWHSPHENKDKFEEQYPADFISEAIDQTRGWFFSLQAISTMLYGKSPYKNVVVFEHALDDKGKKMSKHIGNVLDPWDAFEKHGADVTRWFFFSSVSIGTQYRVSIDILSETTRKFYIPLWNTVNFFVTYANSNNWKPKSHKSNHVLDKWMMARLNEVVENVTKSMDEYNTFRATRDIEEFVLRDLSQWYIRRSRDRMGDDFFVTTYEVLVTVSKLMAPFSPFISDSIYKRLTGNESVHLEDWPKSKKLSTNQEKLIKEMKNIREVVEMIHAERKSLNIPVRQPLRGVTVISPNFKFSKSVIDIAKEELNLKNMTFKKGEKLSVELDTKITPALKEEGDTRELIRKIQNERKKQGVDINDKVNVMNDWLPENSDNLERIRTTAGTATLTNGDFKVKKA